MPLHTREAMLEGIRANPIIVGAYTDRDGGVCPMLAAHRNGGRTSFATFAKAWDRYTRARKPRRASEREVDALRTMLESSIAMEGCKDLGGAIAEHRAIQIARAKREEFSAAAAAPVITARRLLRREREPAREREAEPV